MKAKKKHNRYLLTRLLWLKWLLWDHRTPRVQQRREIKVMPGGNMRAGVKTSHLSTRQPGSWRLTYKGALVYPTVQHRESVHRHYEEYWVRDSIEMPLISILNYCHFGKKNMTIKGWVSILHSKYIIDRYIRYNRSTTIKLFSTRRWWLMNKAEVRGCYTTAWDHFVALVQFLFPPFNHFLIKLR